MTFLIRDGETLLVNGRTLEEIKRMETDPTGRSPHESGAKLDAGKVPVERGALAYFPNALKAVAAVSAFGANKYAWYGWKNVPEGIDRYSDALARHLLEASAQEGFENRHKALDPDSKLLHAAHAAWNALAVLELILSQESDGS